MNKNYIFFIALLGMPLFTHSSDHSKKHTELLCYATMLDALHNAKKAITDATTNPITSTHESREVSYDTWGALENQQRIIASKVSALVIEPWSITTSKGIHNSYNSRAIAIHFPGGPKEGMPFEKFIGSGFTLPEK